MAALTPKLDLDEQIVIQAKRAVVASQGGDPHTADLQKITFSATAELAIRDFGDTIREHLDAAGLARQNVKRGRPRRVSQKMWGWLDQTATDYDTSRIAVLRAALALLAARAPGGPEASATATPRRRKRKRL